MTKDTLWGEQRVSILLPESVNKNTDCETIDAIVILQYYKFVGANLPRTMFLLYEMRDNFTRLISIYRVCSTKPIPTYDWQHSMNGRPFRQCNALI